ncbi:hypothetical protein ES319_A03G153000v1 [Gossypium barbadense]|uniref:Aldehyde dehydrogenase domain-containing protein n=2 Tax=Gossypium TaxID=3633 RepID=A0A5J5WFV0_GOSBA|nr:hypothetical protein ES319_A03G153000v1 [Gossypium barbadense]TYH25491.1 hypothetical protein ES288_A03G173200v1 [Gossypium darwinii]
MAAMRISSLLSCSLSYSSLLPKGRFCGVGRVVSGYSTSAGIENPINPSIKVHCTQLLIKGNFVDSASGKTFPTYDPRTGDVIAHVAEGDAEDIDRAVCAAREAFDEGPWPKMTAYERSKVLFRFADLLDKHIEELATLESHMDVDKLAFTGSSETGKIVLELASKSNLKPVTLELGGKSPFIVCKDADVNKAVELAHFALLFNQGQCCSAGSRAYVHEDVHDEFIEKAEARALKRSVGDPFKAGVEQGPQIDSEQFEKILRYIRSGIESGAILITGGDRLGSKDFYIQPTVFANVKEDMLIAQDEIFGPVQSILKFRDMDEVIRRANSTRYGLAAGVFTNDLDTANTLSGALKVGTVWINCYDVFDAAIPFGGYKMSGQGREKGVHCLSNYLQVKAIVAPLKNPAWI